MPNKTNLTPYLLLVAGITGLLLIYAASTGVFYPQDEAPSSLPPSKAAIQTPSSTSRSVSYTAIPSQPPTTTAPTTAPTVTPAATSTPRPTPTATPVPIALSPPFVSSTGALAYVEGDVLSIVGLDDFKVTMISTNVTSGPQAAIWSPDGRRLLYAASTDSPSTGSTSEHQGIHVWDSQRGETLHLARNVPGFPPGASGVEDAIWSPEGGRVLFPCLATASSCRPWVLDVTTPRTWPLPEPSMTTATWIDEDTILCRRTKGDTLRLLSVAPLAQALTNTVPVSGTYALSPDRGHVASFQGKPGAEQRLHVLPLPDHPSLPLSPQPRVITSGRAPLWSPDNRWLAYAAEALIDHDGEGPYMLLADTQGLGDTQRFPHLLPVAWSPDGRLLAGFGCSETICRLSLVDVVSGQTTSIISAEHLRLGDLAWSPRGVYLIYSVSGSDVDRNGLMLWNRATREQHHLIQADETQLLTDLQWSADGCAFYAAQQDDRGEAGLAVSAIWGSGPTWDDRWRIGPGPIEYPSALVEAPRQGENNQEYQLCPGPLLDGRRLIAYYGTPLGPGLGILGRYDISETLRLLQEQAQVYRDLDPAVDTIPAFHMVTTIADDFPGLDGDYNHRVPPETIRRWIDSARANGAWSILDVQPGRADLADELYAIEPFLLEPGVHLAVDPEFIVGAHQVPGEDLGKITGGQINWLQAQMDRVARASGQRKMLIIHQFDDRMIERKEMILDYPLVDLVWDADGFGGPGAKIGDYDQYKTETGFEHGGFKIFYLHDEPLMIPEDVLSLDPSPRLVIYQ